MDGSLKQTISLEDFLIYYELNNDELNSKLKLFNDGLISRADLEQQLPQSFFNILLKIHSIFNKNKIQMIDNSQKIYKQLL